MQYDTGPVLPLPLNPDHSFTLQHVFVQNSPHAVKVTVTDRFGQSDTETFAMEVTNVAPTVQAGPDVAIRPGHYIPAADRFHGPGRGHLGGADQLR